jgi:ATP-binding cassette subfamily B protein
MIWLNRIKASLSKAPQVFRLIREASPRGIAALIALAIIIGMVPAVLAWLKKLLIDGVVRSVTDGLTPLDGLLLLAPILLAVFGLQTLFNASTQANNLVEHHVKARLTLHINTLIMKKAQSLDLEHFEDAQFYDKLQNAQSETEFHVASIIRLSAQLFKLTLTLTAFIAILVTFSPWLVVIFIFATLPSFALQNHYAHANFRLLTGQAPERRRLLYLKEMLTTDTYKKEVKLFGLSTRFLRQYRDEFWPLFREDMDLAKRQSVISLMWGTIGVVCYLGAIAWIIYRALSQTITFGEAVLYFEVFEQAHYKTQTMLSSSLQLYKHHLFIDNLFVFLAIEPRIASPTDPQPVPTTADLHIEFEDVSFRYPNQTEWTLQNINLSISPGEKLALVGLNGAGKTTLIKLLTRLYEPTTGRITVNGIPLNQIDQEEWHSKIGVIFQDFAKYHLSARENVGFGRVEALHDQQRLEEAARKGGAHDILHALPAGYETTLGRRFEEGQELSLGQWQKVALSRAFMRDAPILVLDEPTAALDAEQEYHTFHNFRRLAENKIAILISHRFSTVRMADRIAVLNAGQLVETGSHDELMRQRGLYARLFSIQAEGYLT